MEPAVDISRYQGTWQDYPAPIVMIKMSGGDAGLYMDSQASNNYNMAVKAGKAVGGYHFIGWTIGATAEANYFMQAMSPVAENDVYALDVEAIPAGVDPVLYVTEMVNAIHARLNLYPLVYMNLSTLNAHDWSPVLANCGLWLADWNGNPNATIPTLHTYVMQQYSDGPNYDHDEWFGTVAQFQKYGYHAPAPVAPAPVAVSQPEPVAIPVSVTPSVPSGTPPPSPTPPPSQGTAIDVVKPPISTPPIQTPVTPIQHASSPSTKKSPHGTVVGPFVDEVESVWDHGFGRFLYDLWRGR